jgi:predicted flap endonuclease-1-like 5' DNA nuclease
MDNNLIIAAIVAIALVIALIFLFKARPATPAAPPAERVVEREGDGIFDSAAAAVEDVAGPLLGIDAHPDLTCGPPDDLTALKGLGPKAAAQLNALGITHFKQIAALSPQDVSAIDARMGNFKGRIARDKWVEQASHLASGDRAGFEAKFGKLG